MVILVPVSIDAHLPLTLLARTAIAPLINILHLANFLSHAASSFVYTILGDFFHNIERLTSSRQKSLFR